MKRIGIAAALLAVGSMLLFADSGTNTINWKEWIMERIDDDTIRELVKKGEVCRVIGHKWQSGCSVGPGCCVIHNAPMRHCVVCGKEETQQVGPWQ